MEKGKKRWLTFLLGVFVLAFLMIMPQQNVQAAGKNGVAKAADGSWYYYSNNQIQKNYNSLAKYNGSWWYFKNGKLDFGYTGLCKYNGSWWYVEKGKVNFGATRLCKYNGSWWYVEKGKVNFSATTLCKYNNAWWYVEKGKVNFSATGLCKYNGSWWYVEKGKVNFSATTLFKYNGSWWYVEKGLVNFSATTLCKYNNAWWYVEKGKVNFTAKTVVRYGGNWWYVTGGKVDFGYEGIAANSSGLWYVYQGKVDFSANGTGTFGNVNYVIINGKAKKEVPCNLEKSDEYYIFELMYKNDIPEAVVNLSDNDKKFYQGFKACLDEAYKYKTAYEQEKAVHDYIVLNCEYGSSAGSGSAEGVFLYKKAVCNGYANAFKLCMDVLGIPCITVSGKVDNGASHVWNSVQLDGDWYVVDVTWDDPVPDKPGEISYQYFNITDAKLRERRTYTTPVEATGTKYYYFSTLPNYFTVEDGVDAYYAYIKEQYEKVGAGEVITVIVESPESWEFADTLAYRDESILKDSNYYAAIRHFNGVYEFYWSFTEYIYN